MHVFDNLPNLLLCQRALRPSAAGPLAGIGVPAIPADIRQKISIGRRPPRYTPSRKLRGMAFRGRQQRMQELRCRSLYSFCAARICCFSCSTSSPWRLGKVRLQRFDLRRPYHPSL